LKERIDIIVDEKRLAENPEKIERLRRTAEMLPVDRIPVIIREAQWTPLMARGVEFREYVASARDNMRQQILNRKWNEENIFDDSPVTEKRMSISPDFGALRGIEFPMEIMWFDNQPAKTVHMLTEPEQIDDLKIPEPETGLCAVKIKWYKEMQQLAGDFDVRLNGEPIEIDVTIRHHGGPIPSAFALAGENLLLWMLTEPDRVHRLMDIAAESFCRVVDYFDDLAGRGHDHPQSMGADAAELISPEMFKEFVVPYFLRVWERYKGPRAFHMCGKIDHLLDILREDLKITDLNGFGFPVDVNKLNDKLCGRCTMVGGPSPMLIHDGPVEAVYDESVRYIKALGPKGGFTMSTGGGSMPGTPWEHYKAMINASKNVGFPEANTKK